MRLGKGIFRLFQGQTGFTLIETIVAVGILGLVGVGVLQAIDTNARATRTLDEQVVASNLATAYIEAIKAAPYDITELYYDDVVAGITIPPQYNVNVDIDFASNSYVDEDLITHITWVDTYTTDENLQKITVSVSREGGKPVLSMCAFKTKRTE